jgi:hypothetical protein
MNETQARLERVETRLEAQVARIDALYRLLEQRGILPRGAEVGRGDALFDDESEVLDLSPHPETRRHAVRRATRFHVGTATGV